MEKEFERIAGELSKIWNYSSIPVAMDKATFEELVRANELALRIISSQYGEGHYENMSHPFTTRVSALPDPEISIVPFRIDYLRNRQGVYTMYDLNTQPGVPGSFFWEEFFQRTGAQGFTRDGRRYGFYREFPLLGEIFKGFAGQRPAVALYQEPDPEMGASTVKGLTAICGKTSSLGHYTIDFVQERARLGDYDIIEPFYFIRGDMARVFSNYETALKEDKPLGSNLKLEPYTSKDMAFARNMDSYLNSDDCKFLKERIAFPCDNGSVKKRLYGMSGTGYYDGDDSVPWSDELVRQERLFPEMCRVSCPTGVREMMYDVGITSIMVFKGSELTDFHPVADITIRAREKHPISGPDTNVVPGVVEL
jgi:hypothetical protein